MKFAFCSFLFLSFINIANAQVSVKVKKFLDEVITAKNINYRDSGGLDAIIYMDEALNHGKVFYRFENDLKAPNSSREKSDIPKDKFKKAGNGWVILDSLVLTDSEAAYVRNEIKKMRTLKWDDNLLPDSRIILADSIAVIRNEYLKLLGARDYQLFLRTKERFIMWQSFSNPVFLRGDTYCLFYSSDHYFSNHEGGGGGGQFSVYKKENGKWLYWCSITRWVT